jgi:hypothetical protein
LDPDTINLADIHCHLFEDNSGAPVFVTTPKMRPRTKHINVKYHHFRSYVEHKLISNKKLALEHQLADILTKPVAQELLIQLPNAITNNTTTGSIKQLKECNYNAIDNYFIFRVL